jgi:hypothetical protein
VQIFKSTGKYQNRYQGGGTPEISHILIFCWFEPVLYLNPVSKLQLPETKERSVYFVGFIDNVGGAMIFNIFKIAWSQYYIEEWLDQQQMPIIVIKSII